MQVKELSALLSVMDPEARVVLDVDLEHCTSDRNVLDIEGVRSGEVEEGPEWVFLDSKGSV